MEDVSILPSCRGWHSVANAVYFIEKQYHQLITFHGFRGRLKTWTTEMTDTDWLTGEMALAHRIEENHLPHIKKDSLWLKDAD